jgi:hypothetical protein
MEAGGDQPPRAFNANGRSRWTKFEPVKSSFLRSGKVFPQRENVLIRSLGTLRMPNLVWVKVNTTLRST